MMIGSCQRLCGTSDEEGVQYEEVYGEFQKAGAWKVSEAVCSANPYESLFATRQDGCALGDFICLSLYKVTTGGSF